MQRAAYRIIDANFNRAREAARVVEEYCRFALNCDQLTARAKKLRHGLSTAVARLDAAKLIANRDTPGDVGVGMAVQGQLKRTDLRDTLTAACKRLPEALRALAETIQSEDPEIAATIEKLRYETYTLEKDIVLFAEPAERFARVRLYALITSDLSTEVISLVHQCAAGGADCIQLRAKNLPDDALLALSIEFARICADAGVLSIINDRVDIAIASNADGVHLGLSDIPVAAARSLQLRPLIIGRTTHNAPELAAAIAELPTYVSLGPVYPTATKPDLEVAGLDYVTESLATLEGAGVAHVAIGAITPDNVAEVITAGVRTVAVCAAVTDSADPETACRTLKDKIEALSDSD